MILCCSALAGDMVLDSRGEDFGRLEHIMLDVPSGRIAYAVLAYGGVFGIGERRVAIPWSALVLDAEQRCLVLGIDPEQLAASPGFVEDLQP
jgi:sporulation protein YlmC with PRC-barrel domain